MRVGLVTHQFFPAFYTGVERLTLNLARQLQRMGHACTVLTSAEHSSRDGAYAHEGVRVRPVESGRVDLARPWRHDAAVAARLRDVVRDEQLELLHVLHPMRLPQAFDVAEELRLPTVVHVADFGYVCARLNYLRPEGSRCPGSRDGAACIEACRIPSGRERVRWGRSILTRADAVVSPCRHTIGLFAAEDFETSGWHHVPWGVDYALYPSRVRPPDGDGLVLGFVGTLLRHKGVHVAIEALRALPDAPIRLLVYGGSFHEGPYEDELRALARGDARIEFRGSYGHDELRAILEELDAVVIPSLWYENLPTTGLNAAAAGVPLIVSDVGGLVELIEDYRAGWTFEVERPDSLARLLRTLLADPAAVREARRAIEYPPGVEEEAWRIEDIYATVLRRHEALPRRSRRGA